MSDTSKRGFIVPIGGAEDREEEPRILSRFVKICGGRSAVIAIIPTASRLHTTGGDYEKVFKRLGVREARSLHYQERADCDRKSWLDFLKRCDGVFITGGNQLRLSTKLGGTPVERVLLSRNLEDGLHIAGTSAGAAIMAQHMISAGDVGPTPRANMVALAPGLGVLERVIVDQHFRQRDRIGRLMTALSYNPTCIGLGLDEDTAALIGPDENLEVLGSGAITVVDPSELEFSSMDSATRSEPVSLVGLRLHVLAEGGQFNLRTRAAQASARASARR